jgi:hypothetical protein
MHHLLYLLVTYLNLLKKRAFHVLALSPSYSPDFQGILSNLLEYFLF